MMTRIAFPVAVALAVLSAGGCASSRTVEATYAEVWAAAIEVASYEDWRGSLAPGDANAATGTIRVELTDEQFTTAWADISIRPVGGETRVPHTITVSAWERVAEDNPYGQQPERRMEWIEERIAERIMRIVTGESP